MATGGGEFGNKDPDLDNQLDHDDDDDEEQEVNRTQPFQPGAASTPYHGGEQMEMHSMQHEQSGLPNTSYQEETHLLSGFIHPDDENAMIEDGWDKIKKLYPEANRAKLRPIKLGKERGNQTSLVIKPGKKEYSIFQKDGMTQKIFHKIERNSSG